MVQFIVLITFIIFMILDFALCRANSLNNFMKEQEDLEQLEFLSNWINNKN